MKRLKFIAIIAMTVLAIAYSGISQINASIDDTKQKELKVGDVAPDITAKTLGGKDIKLSDLKGKVVLIDFWASWCGPCRHENPSVLAAYKKYHNKSFTKGSGFEVFSLSLDRDAAKWKEAVAADALTWDYNVSDMKNNDSQSSKDYTVRFIPTNYLIDKDGVIIATQLRGEALEAELEKILK